MTAEGAILESEPLGSGFRLERAGLELGGRSILAGLDLDLAPGECVALVGPSGAGKTSLLRLLGTALAPSRGRLAIDGEEPARMGAAELRALRARLGFVHQDLALVPGYSASRNVLLGRLGRRGFFAGVAAILAPRRAERVEVHTLLERLGIGELFHQPVEHLSGGEQQRVAVARALHQEPRALLCDEPLASVDPARSRDLLELLVGLARERGLTLVCSLHDLELAREHFPRLIGLREGRVQFDAAPSALGASAFDALYRLPAGFEGGATLG